MSTIFSEQLESKKQVRQRVAYALSQTVIASESGDNFFRIRGEALSYYYDSLVRNAFGNYADVLYDVSMTSAMGTYLTYDGNKKAHDDENNVSISPDENYGREIMQLFSIGLFDLNPDGTINYIDGQPKPSYTQEDVIAMARVFTGLYSYGGLEYGDAIRGNGKRGADSLRPLECSTTWHDSDDKFVLGQTLTGSDDCAQEVRNAVNLLINHHNTAPFISKKLILRLTKSNPSTEYISRVSSVFKASGGDLKKVVRAILLDQELWSDIIQGTGTKIKEPYLTFTAMLRAFNVEPPTQWTSGKTVIRVTRNKYYMGHNTLYGTFGQAPTMAPNVFNFYQDDFIPNDFKSLELVAPEIYIKTMPNTISYNNWLIDILNLERDYILQRYTSIDAYFAGETKEGQPKLLLNIPEAYESVLNVLNSYEDIPKHTDKMLHVEVYKLIAGEITDWLSIRLLGEKLPSETRDIIVTHFAQTAKMEVGKERFGTPKRQLYERLIMPITRAIVASDHYSVQ